MDGLYEWVRNIAYYLIFITVVTSLLPNQKYEKYMKLFAGMVLILLVLKPLTSGLRLDDKLAYYFEAISFQKETDDLRQQFSGMEKERLDSMMGQYESAVAMDLERMAGEEGLYKKHIAVTIEDGQDEENFGMVSSITMILTEKEMPDEAEAFGIAAIEPVEIQAGQPKEETELSYGEGTAKIQSLRTRITEYYGLEAQQVEIQLENG